ncbi:MAG: 3-isopropylmalate dehydratase small subunit [Candidatus Riflebacteria bacterium]|nr:3-isopropylmalate dehydratase small subunit [Candidatus Riflebacteria bacterium]
MSTFRGKTFVYGDDINTDVIFPGRYLNVFDPAEMAKHAMEDLDKDFVKNAAVGDIVVAGKYFGCGSSREQAATCLKAVGISVVIAKSFARIFYRNAINQGLAIMICPGIDEIVQMGDQLEVDPTSGVIKNLTRGGERTAKPLPPFIMGILNDGGLIPHLQKSMKSA